MGWGTDFTTSVYLNRQVFGSREEVKMRLEDIQEELSVTREHLFLMLGAGLMGIPGDDIDTGVVHREASELLKEIEDLSRERTLLTLYLEYLEENDITIIKRHMDE
jgi:hypothetical protein